MIDTKLEALCQRRVQIQLAAEKIDESVATECWARMGVAHRHIERVSTGILSLTPGVEYEITDCFRRVEEWLRTKKSSMGKSGLGDQSE